MQLKNIGTVKALQKIKHFCSYQERNHTDVKKKLYSFGLYKPEVETILAELISEDYLNEERYAMAFAGGKFRQLKWGKIKISYALKQNGVSEYCIKKALLAIGDDEYTNTLKRLFEAKWKTLSDTKLIKLQKVKNYLLQKGYAYNDIRGVVPDER